MKSAVARSETQNVGHDFIMVPQPDDMRDDLLDDDSYDYCEGVYSFQSIAQTMSTCSGVAENVIPKDVIVTVDCDMMEDSEDAHCNDELNHISVPSVLMKDLDEAHAAAELVRISDSEQRSVASTLTGHTFDDVKKVQNAQPVHLSRASNKKRRKQLKLMKKAQAAANAVQTLEEKANRAANFAPEKAFKSKGKPLGSRSPKKIANIAVVCATETLSAYRQELVRNKQQCV